MSRGNEAINRRRVFRSLKWSIVEKSLQGRWGPKRNMPRPEIHRWYKTASWLRRRRHQLRLEPLCRTCLDQGRSTPATVADHHPPHKNDFNAFRLSPLRSLCGDCHARLDDATNEPRRVWGYTGTGMPRDPDHPWNRGS
jgi:5-methylcytosine-specific restriction protein A